MINKSKAPQRERHENVAEWLRARGLQGQADRGDYSMIDYLRLAVAVALTTIVLMLLVVFVS